MPTEGADAGVDVGVGADVDMGCLQLVKCYGIAQPAWLPVGHRKAQHRSGLSIDPVEKTPIGNEIKSTATSKPIKAHRLVDTAACACIN